MEEINRLLQQYHSRGLLIDANILLMYFVGRFDRTRIPRFKRTEQFSVSDFDLLVRLMPHFRRLVATPHVLAEVNSLSNAMAEPAKTHYFEMFAQEIERLDEEYVSSSVAACLPYFPRFGLTDSTIISLAERFLVLTDDLKLARFLNSSGRDALNFNHLRWLDWQ